jgi:hypothetical protein
LQWNIRKWVVRLQTAKSGREWVGQRLVATARLRCLYLVLRKPGRVGLLSKLWLWCLENWWGGSAVVCHLYIYIYIFLARPIRKALRLTKISLIRKKLKEIFG